MNDAVLHTPRSLPKIELHRHLEGSLRIQTLVSIALEHGLTLPSFTAEGLRPFVQMMPGEPRSWQHFLSKFQVLRQFYRSKKVIQRVTHEVIADAAADNVRYMELRFTPQALNNLVKCDYAEVVEWVCEAAHQAAQTHAIQVALILSMNRHESVDIGSEVVDAAIAFRDRGVVGIDLAGQEANISSRPFAALFERARAEGLFVTAHAGEWAGPESVREVVETLNPDRLGHGVRASEDAEVMQLLRDRGITLEVCPSSNIDSGTVASYAVHPLRTLYQSGVRTTINTDDPLISNITLTDEYSAAMEHLGFGLVDVQRNILNAAEAAFLPPEGRADLAARFQTWFTQRPPAGAA